MAAKRQREPIYVTLGEIGMFKLESVNFDSEDKTDNDIVTPPPTATTPFQEESDYFEGSQYSEEFEEMDDDYDDYEELPQIEETTISSNTDESSEREKGPSRRFRILGIDIYFTYFLFYVTVIQSCMKAIISVCIMSMNFNFNLDTPCQGPECPKPVPVEKRAAYFLPCLAVFGISTFHFCVGVWMFTKGRSVSLTIETLKLPMTWFAIIIGLEMAALYVIFQVTEITLPVMIGCAVVLTTEIISVLIAFCYPCFKPLRRKVPEETTPAPDNPV